MAALVLAAIFYAMWNWRGLYGELAVKDVESGPDSPTEMVPERLLRSGPVPAPIFEGDRVGIELGLRTRGAARGPARLFGSIAGHDLSVAAGLVPRSGWSERKEIGPTRRGAIAVSGWVLEAGDPIGMFRHRSAVGAAGELALVLPRFTSLSTRPDVREIEASVAAPRAGSGNEVFGVREFQPGDPLRRIHWRSSARHGELIVREFEPPGVRELGIFCDPSPSTREVADQIARLAASEAWDCIRDGGRAVLWAPGLAPSRPDESRSFWALLEWLARYPDLGAETNSDPPPIRDAVAVMGNGADDVIEALDAVRQHGGSVRAWVVGEGEGREIDGQVTRVGTTWPV